MIVCALDMSLSGAGVVILRDGNMIHAEKLSSKKMTTKAHKDETALRIFDIDDKVLSESFIESSDLLDMKRVEFYHDRIEELLLKYEVESVVIEGYSFGSKGRAGTSLSELGGVIRFMMYKLNLPYIQCPPTTAKAFITGLSNAKKNHIQMCIKEKYGILIKDDNIADAFAMGMFVSEHKTTAKDLINAGGVDRLRQLKAEDYRFRYKDTLQRYRKIIELGVLNTSDFFAAVQGDKMDIDKNSKLLGITREEYIYVLKKDSVKKLNDKYKVKGG